jgi:hypothetical protein
MNNGKDAAGRDSKPACSKPSVPRPRFVFRVDRHILIVEHSVPIAAHLAPVFRQRARRPRPQYKF